MIDAHIHIEHQPYSIETINKMVNQAITNHISEIRIVDHTHKFIEFKDIYFPIYNNQLSKQWYDKKKLISIKEYLDFIEDIKQRDFPITIKFGLEVCYFEESQSILKEILFNYHFDFLIGSVHFIDGLGFDLSLLAWENQDIDHLYQRYYEIMESLIKSQIFDSLAHPDSIKLFNKYPSYDLVPTYSRIANLLLQYNVKTENNTGLKRYNFSYPGMNQEMYKIFKEKNVVLEKASDAHKYEDIGYDFEKISI
jgi:histidinol-phosphatase (PHP family)